MQLSKLQFSYLGERSLRIILYTDITYKLL